MKVLRARPGQVVSLYDEQGHSRTATIRSVDHRRAVAHLDLSPGPVAPPASAAIELGVGFLKGSKLDEVIRFAASMGVRGIHPFVTTRSVAAQAQAPGIEKLSRWKRIANQACKISPGVTPPFISAPTSLVALIARMSGPCAKIILWEGSAPPLAGVLKSKNVGDGIALLVGPEGGFSEEDVTASEAAGFRRASLGPYVFRSEYATQIALILTLHAMGLLG